MARYQIGTAYTSFKEAVAMPILSSELKDEIRAHKGVYFAFHRRIALVLAIFSWIAFLYWDLTNHNAFPHFQAILNLRIGGAFVLVGVFIISANPRFLDDAFSEAVLISAVLISWVLVMGMMLASPAPNNYLDYYPGLPLIYLFLFAVLWIETKKAFVISVFLFLVFNLVQWHMYTSWSNFALNTNNDPGELANISQTTYQVQLRYYWGSANFYLTAFILLGFFISYQLERYFLLSFVNERKIAENANQKEAHSLMLMDLKDSQRRMAVEANQSKSRFLSEAAHDIRQPLTAFGAMLEAISHAHAKGDLRKSAQYLDEAGKALRALRNTLNEVLDISRLDSGAIAPEYSEFDLANLILEVCEPLSLVAKDSGLDFRIRLPKKKAIFVKSDYVLMARVITNLVANAIKYTKPKEQQRSGVLVGLVLIGGRARVDIQDTGIGINPQHQEAIFRPFFQVENRERDREKGLGLGLSIVAKIIAILDQHRIDFSSIPGKGSRFSIEIPIIEYSQEADISSSLESGIKEADLKGRYVLFVEDDLLVRRSIAIVMESWGAQVHAAASVSEVSQFLGTAERIPNLILTDFQLPEGKNAFDIISMVREEFRRKIPAVILTGETDIQLRDSIDVSAVVAKPPDIQALKNILATAVLADSGRPGVATSE